MTPTTAPTPSRLKLEADARQQGVAVGLVAGARRHTSPADYVSRTAPVVECSEHRHRPGGTVATFAFLFAPEQLATRLLRLPTSCRVS